MEFKSCRCGLRRARRVGTEHWRHNRDEDLRGADHFRAPAGDRWAILSVLYMRSPFISYQSLPIGVISSSFSLLNSYEFLVCNRHWGNQTSFWWSATICCTGRCGADTASSSAVFVLCFLLMHEPILCGLCPSPVLFHCLRAQTKQIRFQSLFTISIWQSVPLRPDLERSGRASARRRRRATAAAWRVPLCG